MFVERSFKRYLKKIIFHTDVNFLLELFRIIIYKIIVFDLIFTISLDAYMY